MLPWLSWSALCRPGWPGTHRNSPASFCLLIAGIKGHMPPCPASASFLTHPGTICPELDPPTVSQAQSLIKKMPCTIAFRQSDGRSIFSVKALSSHMTLVCVTLTNASLIPTQTMQERHHLNLQLNPTLMLLPHHFLQQQHLEHKFFFH